MTITLVTEKSNDSVSLTPNATTRIATFKVDTIDSSRYHLDLIANVADSLDEDPNIDEVEIIVPNNGKKLIQKQVGEVYNEETDMKEPVFEEFSVWDNNYFSCPLFDIKDFGTITDKKSPHYGDRTVLVNKSDFHDFYTCNIVKLLSNVSRKFKSYEDDVDDEGFTLVRNKNKKKLRSESKSSLKSDLFKIQKNAQKHVKNMLKESNNNNQNETD